MAARDFQFLLVSFLHGCTVVRKVFDIPGRLAETVQHRYPPISAIVVPERHSFGEICRRRKCHAYLTSDESRNGKNQNIAKYQQDFERNSINRSIVRLSSGCSLFSCASRFHDGSLLEIQKESREISLNICDSADVFGESSTAEFREFWTYQHKNHEEFL
jgi:hypothetical protein